MYFALKFETQLFVLNFTVIHFVLHCTALCKTPDPFRTDVVYNARRRMLKRDRKPDQGLQQNGIILMMMIFRNPLILNVSVTELGVISFHQKYIWYRINGHHFHFPKKNTIANWSNFDDKAIFVCEKIIPWDIILKGCFPFIGPGELSNTKPLELRQSTLRIYSQTHVAT